MKRLFFLIPLLVVLAIGVFLAWGLDPDRDPSELPSMLIGRQVPTFDLPAIAGLNVPGVSDTDLVHPDRGALVNVFASWCVPCRAEHAVLKALVETEGVRLLGLNYKDKPEDAAAWLDELGNPYERIGSDLAGRIALEWGVSGVPETFVVDRHGIVRLRHVGPLLERKTIDRVLKTLGRPTSR